MSFYFKLYYVNLQWALCSNKITMSWCLISNTRPTGWESQNGKTRIQHLFFPLIFAPPQVVLSLSDLAVEKPFYTSSLCQWGNRIFIIETRLFDHSSKNQAISRCSTISFVLAGTMVFPWYLPLPLALVLPIPITYTAVSMGALTRMVRASAATGIRNPTLPECWQVVQPRHFVSYSDDVTKHKRCRQALLFSAKQPNPSAVTLSPAETKAQGFTDVPFSMSRASRSAGSHNKAPTLQEQSSRFTSGSLFVPCS